MDNKIIKDYETFINESSLMRIKSHFSNYDCGFITAFRTYKGCGETKEKYTLEENLKRNKLLYMKLAVGTHYGITKVKGSYIENFNSDDKTSLKESTENVYFVVDLQNRGTLLRDLVILGRSCNQDSVLYIPKSVDSSKDGAFLIGTNNCPDGYPGYNNMVAYYGVNWGNLGMFHTKVKSRPFFFKNVEIFNGYKTDLDGNFILDKNGDKIPIYEIDDNPVEIDFDSMLDIKDSDIEIFESVGGVQSPFLIETDLTNLTLPSNYFDDTNWIGKMGMFRGSKGKFY